MGRTFEIWVHSWERAGHGHSVSNKSTGSPGHSILRLRFTASFQQMTERLARTPPASDAFFFSGGARFSASFYSDPLVRSLVFGGFDDAWFLYRFPPRRSHGVA